MYTVVRVYVTSNLGTKATTGTSHRFGDGAIYIHNNIFQVQKQYSVKDNVHLERTRASAFQMLPVCTVSDALWMEDSIRTLLGLVTASSAS